MLLAWKRETVEVFLPFLNFVLSNRPEYTAVTVVEEIIYWDNVEHIGTDDRQPV